MNKKAVLVVLAVIAVIAVSGIIGAEYYTSRPQFCGSCHIMKKHYDQWKKDKHAKENVACVDCHYAPGEKMTPHAKFKGLGQLFSYLATKDEIVQKKAKVPDFSCTASSCHPQNEEFLNKNIKFTEKIGYKHKTHFDKTIEGQTLHCDTCHQHISPEKHFEVPKVACYLCHFKNVKFNEGRGKCASCHEIPDKALQQLEEGAEPPKKIITHKTLEDSKVACESCHYQLIQGEGDIKKEGCFNCHDYSEEMLKKAGDKKLMHESHVASQEAHCFECHTPIAHKEIPHFEAARRNCKTCHPDHHVQQMKLLAGTGGAGTERDYPIRHFNVKVNCFACHTKDGDDNKGVTVLKADTERCAACHTEDEKDLAMKWKEDIYDFLEEAKEIQQEALKAIEDAKGKVPESDIRRAQAMVSEGRENIKLVIAGAGVHNKKYSVLLLDIAMEKFDDAIAELE